MQFGEIVCVVPRINQGSSDYCGIIVGYYYTHRKDMIKVYMFASKKTEGWLDRNLISKTEFRKHSSIG